MRWAHIYSNQLGKVRTACEKVQKGTLRSSKVSCGRSFADVLPSIRGGLLALCTIWLTMNDNECTMQCKGQGSHRCFYYFTSVPHSITYEMQVSTGLKANKVPSILKLSHCHQNLEERRRKQKAGEDAYELATRQLAKGKYQCRPTKTTNPRRP